MRDQSHGRINGSAAAAFTTICERNRNTASVLKERRRVRRRFVGQRYAQRFANPSRAVDKLFCNERSAAGSVNESFSQLMCSNDTAIQSIDRCRWREDRRPWQPATFTSRGPSETGELFDRGDNILISCGAEKLVARQRPKPGTDDALARSNDTGLCLTRRIEQMVTFPHSRRVERM